MAVSMTRTRPSIVGRVRRRLRRRSAAGLPAATRLDQRKDLEQFEIGRYTWGHLTVSNRTPGATLQIGQFCSLAYGVHILLGGEHRTDFVSTYRFPAYPEFQDSVDELAPSTSATRGSVTIGNDVWVGNEALILSGVTIGDGAVVGAGSVVRQNIPSYAIVAGNPGRVAGFRFPAVHIAALQRISWWDWPISRISSSLDLMMSDDIQRFIDAFDPGPEPAGSAEKP